MKYEEFLKSKQFAAKPSGFEAKDIHAKLFQFQKDIVSWACHKGKACVFAGTGLGKTLIQLEWANQVYKHSGKDVLILAPLAVVAQTVAEGAGMGLTVHACRKQDDVLSGINITNYEMLDHFDTSHFAGVVLDESSIIKSFEGKVRTQIIESFRETPYRLACTATPAPNDVTELANHVEFLGIKSRHELLSEYFVHDGGQTSIWRLKRHAVKRFWEFVAGWAVMMQMPSELGYEDNGFKLPPINIEQIVIDKTGYIVKEALTLQDRRGARRDSLSLRVAKAAEIVNASNESWIVWCDLNVESEALKRAIPGSVEVKGSDDPDYKAKSLSDFAKGLIRILVTKSSIAGFGLNMQVCHNQVFVGISDSFEGYYQAVRRSWRFGQTQPVNVFVITSEKEGAVVKNIQRKEKDFDAMLRGMISQTQELTKQNLKQTTHSIDEYNPTVEMVIPRWCKSFA
ncbi:DEAD/DEAH box helicase [Candidatus Pacearchaeota archaeon]|jgi:hypothetical protein|nr:DEAD/DEAH box helicase [Candidatus Pacearchaeota archaeon]